MNSLIVFHQTGPDQVKYTEEKGKKRWGICTPRIVPYYLENKPEWLSTFATRLSDLATWRSHLATPAYFPNNTVLYVVYISPTFFFPLYGGSREAEKTLWLNTEMWLNTENPGAE
jgi:hypothetical protein